MSKPTVTLTFAGDESKLTDSFDKVGKSSTKMEEDVTKSSEKLSSGGGTLDKLTERADGTEKRFIGFSDILSGGIDGLEAWGDESLSTGEKMQKMGMAVADIAGGMANFLLPVLGQVATFMKTQLASAFTFIAAHPLIFTLTALVAVFALLWTQSETFRRIVIDVFNAVGGFIRNVFVSVIDWVLKRWNDVIDFFKGIPKAIGDAFAAVGRFIGDAFKGALNVAIDILNWFVDRANNLIYGINVISPFNDIPYIPHIPRMHNGGIVGGAPGSEQLTMLQAGETVGAASAPDGSRGAVVRFDGDTDGAFATAFQKLVRDKVITIEVG